MPKISIIIPVYNSSKYLKRCLSSVLNQQLNDYEIILIDDKSKDNSLELIEQFKSKFPNKIKVIENSENLGAGYSRNKGLSLAAGEYIGFVDSDDYIEPQMYKDMYDVVKENNSDIAITGMDLRFFNLNLFFLGRSVKLEKNVYYPKIDKTILTTARPSCCNKIFKRELIGDNKFLEGLKWEDYPFVVLMLGLSDNISVINKDNYHYRINPFGTTCTDAKKVNNRILEIFTVSDKLEESFDKNNIKDIYFDELRTLQIVNSLGRVRDCAFMSMPYDQKVELINNLLNLIEIKYGDWQNNKWYINQKESSRFYRMRMEYIEQNFSFAELRTETDEQIIKQKIKNMIICK